MKKFAVLLITLLGCTTIFAAPVGNSSAVDIIQEGFFIPCDSWFDFRWGYEGDFVADGRMKQYKEGSGRVDNYEQMTNSGTATINFLDGLDVYGVFGSSRTKADWRYLNPNTNAVTRIEVETDYDFLWAAGARAILFEWSNTVVGFGGRYSYCNYKPAWITSNGTVQNNVTGAKFRWKEWQVNLDISYKIDLFTPYIGLKYSNAKTELKRFPIAISSSLTGFDTFKNRIPVGLYFGCTLSTGQYFMLNLEGRVIDEEAATVSAEFRF